MTEYQLQCAVVDFLRLHEQPGLFWTAINPIPAKSRSAAGRSKRLGMKAGVPDLLVIWQGDVLWIELKSRRGSVSEAQRMMANELVAAGCTWATARDLDYVVTLLEDLGVPLKARPHAVA